MRRTISILVALVVLVGGGATVAVAKAPGKGKARAAKVQQQRTLMAAATAYLELSRPALARELRAGKSLAQVATARGKSVDGLEQALVAALRSKIEAARAAGRIDAARAQRMSARAEQLVERIVNAMPKARARAVRAGVLGIAARYVGLTRPQLAAELRAGKSLAQVATARGKSVDGLESALLAPLQRKLDAAVAAGRFDAARARQVLERASARIERLVNRTRA
jgi:lambda repressor-like predicted transcriptional regulator